MPHRKTHILHRRVPAFFFALLFVLVQWVSPQTAGEVDAAEEQTAAQTITTEEEEYRGVWFSYYDFEKYRKSTSKNNETKFRAYFKKVVKTVKARGLNTIIVQVRPTGDAIYDSDIFPTSSYIAGKQGKSLSYDPLTVMTEEAHKAGIKIEAWINPYRVSFGTSYSALAKDNPARKWHESSSASERRNVLSYGGKLYYNPSKPEVRQLIIDGVTEIVKNYDVDGIHMDDYFYPSFTSRNYNKTFDSKEYNSSDEKKKGMSIEDYRRLQVNILVKGIKAAVKAANPDVTFGISPAGNISHLKSKYAYYVDIKTWTNSTDYVDYIAPQIYWGFYHKTAPFKKMVDQWKEMTDTDKVELYIGLPAYKMGSRAAGTTSKERSEMVNKYTLKKMVKYIRKKKADGYILFDYSDLNKNASKVLANYVKN